MTFRPVCIFIFILLTASWMRISGQTWAAPDEAKSKVCSFRFTPETIEAGEALFIKNCQSCHGYPGKQNWANIAPPPGDPASVKFQSQTDGELFWKITNGKAPMPEFRNILSEEERWHVISFIRSFNPKYSQPTPEVQAGLAGKVIRLTLDYIPKTNKIKVRAHEIMKDKKEIPFKGAEIQLFVNRYFGNMLLGDPKTTDERGEVFFNFPADLPGDKDGNVELTALVHDNTGQMGESQVKARLAIGKPNTAPNLLANRAWWSTRLHAPVWVILTYSLAVIIAWGFIVYIVYTVLRMRKMS